MYMLGKLMNTYHVYIVECISPALNGSSVRALQTCEATFESVSL